MLNFYRGVLMLLAAGGAFWKGWQIHHGTHAWLAYGLGAAALGLAVWHLTRKEEGRKAGAKGLRD